ncbi:MAG: hypothetical protein AAFW73_26990 [Bacteroidota bacterium]
MTLLFFRSLWEWLLYKWFNWTGTVSGVLLTVIDDMEGGIIGMILFALVGAISVKKAWNSMQHEKLKDEQERENAQQAFNQQQLQDRERHELEMKALHNKIDSNKAKP